MLPTKEQLAFGKTSKPCLFLRGKALCNMACGFMEVLVPASTQYGLGSDSMYSGNWLVSFSDL